MSYSKVIIHDYHSLIQLNDAIDYCGDSLLKLLKEVDLYLQNCIGAFEEQRNMLKEHLLIAEKQLQDAESEYSNCIASQREYTDEDGSTHISPSCSSEKSKVESARQNVAECRRKLEKAETILSDCKYEINEYKFYSPIVPNGGEKTLEFVAKYHTDEAQSKLNKILEIVEKYLGRPLLQTLPNETLSPTKEQQFEKATEKVKAKQRSESSNIADANVSMVCNRCHRPMPICVCSRTRDRIR